MKNKNLDKVLIIARKKEVDLLEYADALETLTPEELDELTAIQDAEYFEKNPKAKAIIEKTAKRLRECVEIDQKLAKLVESQLIEVGKNYILILELVKFMRPKVRPI